MNAFSLSPEGGGEEGRNGVEATPHDRGPRIATGGDPSIPTGAARPREATHERQTVRIGQSPTLTRSRASDETQVRIRERPVTMARGLGAW